MLTSLSGFSPVILTPLQGRQPIVQAETVAPVKVQASSLSFAPITVSTSRYSPAYGEAKEILQKDFSNPLAVDDRAHVLLKNASRGSVAGGALRMSELLQRGDTEYQQDMRQYSTFSFPTKDGEYPPLDLGVFEERSNKSQEGFSFQLKTKDGDTINFSFERYEGYGVAEGETVIDERGFHITDKRTGGFQGVEIAFDVDGRLSNDEKAQLDQLAEKLEGLTTAYFDNGEANFNEFDFSQFDLMEKVNLSFENQGKEVLSVQYTDTDLYRSIEMEAGGASGSITIDKTSLGMNFDAQQQAAAKQAYLSLINDAAIEAKSPKDIAMMQTVFQMGFSNLVPESEQESAANYTDIKLGEQASSSVLALPDFTFSYRSNHTQPNVEHKPDEYQGFQLELSLKTQISDNKNSGKMDIVQTQKFDLEGAYYEPLDHLEGVDFENQNYKYTEFSRSSEKVSHLMMQDGAIESLLVAEEGEEESKTDVYQDGRLVDEIKKKSEFAYLKDVTELAQEQSSEQNQEMLSTLIIDPYEKNKNPRDKGIVQLDGAVEWLRSELGHVINKAA